MAYHYASRRTMGRMPCAPGRKPGQWKIAYADFLTALMAFFLALWLISGASKEERAELASFFTGDVSAAATVFEADPVESQIHVLKQTLTAFLTDGQLEIFREGDSVRLEIMDQSSAPIFESGAGNLNEQGEQILKAVALAVASQAQMFAIEGHTDAFPSADPNWSNWDVSTARAQSARRVLVSAGVDAARITGVIGRAGTIPLRPTEPHLPANRRISIILHVAETQ